MRVLPAWSKLRRLPGPLWVLFTDTFAMAVGFYLLIPLFAYHLLENLAWTAAVVGVIAAVRSFSQQGLMVWSGALADRIGYRNAICAGVVVRAVGFAIFGVAESVPAFLVGSVLAGLGGSLFHPASYATYAVLSEDADRVTIYSVRELLSNVGFVLGPLVGGIQGDAMIGTLMLLKKHLRRKMFEPLAQNPPRRTILLVRASMDDPLKMAGAVQAA